MQAVLCAVGPYCNIWYLLIVTSIPILCRQCCTRTSVLQPALSASARLGPDGILVTVSRHCSFCRRIILVEWKWQCRCGLETIQTRSVATSTFEAMGIGQKVVQSRSHAPHGLIRRPFTCLSRLCLARSYPPFNYDHAHSLTPVHVWLTIKAFQGVSSHTYFSPTYNGYGHEAYYSSHNPDGIAYFYSRIP
jgi:hypothetical protein